MTLMPIWCNGYSYLIQKTLFDCAK